MSPADAVAARPGTGSLADLVALAKPRITVLMLLTTAGGLWLGPGVLTPARAGLFLTGVALLVAAASALNMYLERDVDALMARTRQRPLPAGRMAPEMALLIGLLQASFAIPLIALTSNPLTALLSLASLVVYVAVYTPLKRRSTLALMVGAVPGAMPPLMGWTAMTGHLDAAGLGLFALLFAWQLPHFIAISIFREDDYVRAGLKVLPRERGIGGARVRLFAWSILQLAASLWLSRLGIGGRFYLAAALALGAVLIGLSASGFAKQDRAGVDRWARACFFYSLIYLPLAFAALMLGRG